MNKHTTQYAIIEHIKNFVKSTGRPWRKRNESGISENVARRIQKKSYERSLRELDNSFYPPYLKIAEQLQVTNEQIFCAAAFNLGETAVNMERYRNHITQILQNSLQSTDLTSEQTKAVKTALQKIASTTNKKIGE